MIVFWSARILSASSSWRSAGAPRRIAALRFSPFPASAVPNSLMISCRRRLNGSRSVFWTRSACTVWVVRSTGTLGSAVLGSSSSPSSSSAGIGSPFGSQSMKYSAISDCGSDEHSVSVPSVDSGPESWTVTTARFSALMSRSLTVPAVTPAIRTSEPVTMPKALSSSIV